MDFVLDLSQSKNSKTCVISGDPFQFACSNEPHTPYTKGDASAYPPASLKLPPSFVDTPETRESFSKYLAEITYYDWQCGALLDLLDEFKLRDNTMVIVVSEQGSAFPFAKWTCFELGLASGMIVRWPGVVGAGTTSDALVEYVDVTPTLLEAAGVTVAVVLDGPSGLLVVVVVVKVVVVVSVMVVIVVETSEPLGVLVVVIAVELSGSAVNSLSHARMPSPHV